MNRLTHSVVMIVPLALKDDVERLASDMGYNLVLTAMVADVADPDTQSDWGTEMPSAGAKAAILSGAILPEPLGDGSQFDFGDGNVLVVSGWTPNDINTLRDQLIVSPRDDGVRGRAHYNEVLTANNKQDFALETPV